MRRLALVVAAVAALLLPALASGHPLGNFTVNRHAGIDVAGRDVYVRFALDLAEIPSYQLGEAVRKPGYAARIARDLVLTVDGRRSGLRVVERRVTTRPGAGGLPTLRLDVVYEATLSGGALTFESRAFVGRVGWSEVTVSARDGARVVSASVASDSPSDVLRAYPADRLDSPTDVSSAIASVEPGPAPGSPPTIESGPTAATGERGRLTALAGSTELSLGALLLAFLVAASWGAAHALTPGHGKALVAAYLVGTRGTPRHALLLGGTVTVTHTAGVFALGFVTLALSRFVLPEQLYPWLTFVSGLLVVTVGASVLRQRLRSRSPGHAHGHAHGQDHGHDHGQDHEHVSGHHHDHDGPSSTRDILGVGVAAGLLPCPSALVLLLSAIALQRVPLGLALVVAFSIGLAGTITAIGLAAVLARRTFARISLDGPVVRALPALSAAVILGVGLVITVRAIPAVV